MHLLQPASVMQSVTAVGRHIYHPPCCLSPNEVISPGWACKIMTDCPCLMLMTVFLPACSSFSHPLQPLLSTSKARPVLQHHRMLVCCARMSRLQRRELIGAVDFSQQQQRFAREQDVLEGKQDVTASLRRTRQLMMQNLEQTHGNISVLGACAAGAGQCATVQGDGMLHPAD